MKKTKAVVIILSDETHLHDDVAHFLQAKGHEVVVEPDHFGDSLAREGCKIILIAYQNLLEGIERYSQLVADFGLDRNPHYSIVLSISKDVGKACELCINQTVDNYFIVKPLYDMHRLALLVKQAFDAVAHSEQQLALTYIGEELLEHKKALDSFIIDNVDKGVECQTDTVDAFSAALNELANLIAGHSGRNLILDHQKIAEQTRELSDRKLEQISAWAKTVKEEYNELSRLQIPTVSGNQKNIALINGDAEYSASVKQILTDTGFNPMLFESAKEALPAMICQRPDLVLLDYETSGLDVLKVLAYMQKFNQLTDIPVILLTAHRDKEILTRCLKAGARDFIVKPADRDTFREKISKLLSDMTAPVS
ncbi:Response regulator receiver domain-containing protein [Amphritea atlantica]|uniref:Response regulator receiver domain-containing protein n=1 Tax=Amphritea atlantica TaxID=355243 RepID=A0A1H9E920_9GAMM|nr:response regulator [Amphritea atlantica]SEQ22159.1 Response regulator receiver domain-containing protein [Amphritea atlantica]